MNLQKKLIQLSEYKCSFKYVDSYFLISMTYPTNWSIIPSEDRSVEVAEEDGNTFYVAPIETDIEKAFTLIDDTISYNLDVEKKMALLKYNIGKLQELFAEKDLGELETLKFIFDTPRETSSKRKSRKASTVKKSVKKVVKKATVNEVTTPTEDVSTDVVLNDNQNETETYDFEQEQNIQVTANNKYLEEVER